MSLRRSLYHFLNLAFALALLWPAVANAQRPPNDSLIKKLNRIRSIDSVKTYGQQLLSGARKNNDKAFEARLLFALSFKYYKNGQEKIALDYARKAGKIVTPADSATYVQTQTMIAWMLSRSGDTKGGLTTAFAILREAENRDWKSLAIDCKVCISDLYRPVKNIPYAVKFAREAADASLALRDTGKYIGALSMLAYSTVDLPATNTADSARNLSAAITYLKRLLNPPFAGRLGLFKTAQLLGNLGTFYRKQDSLDLAEQVLQQSLTIASNNQFVTLQKHDVNELMSISMDRKNYKKAVDYGEKALALQSEANSSRPLQLNFYRGLTEAYAGTGDYKQALKYSEKARMLRDSMLTDGQSVAMAELDKKYENDKRVLQVSNRNALLQQQRNFTILTAIIVLIGLIALYRWYAYKKNKAASLLAEEHRQLERLDAMKTRFLANISHELKTPLTLIMGPTEQLLQSPATSEEQKDSLKTISRNSKKLLDMVNELLDLGKVESGSIAVKQKPVNLAALVKLVFQGFASAAEYKHITYTLACNVDDKLHVLLDREKFEKIANNLISNAIKFTPAGRAVNVVAGVSNGQIGFSVEDNGSGIHPDDADHVFDRYYQGSRNEAAEGGTGIGLSIAKEFAELMGGNITLDNNWGEGSTFKVNLPLVPITVEDSGSDVHTTDSRSESLEKPISSGQTILLVEDHNEMTAYITSILQPHYRVITAANGVQALQMLSAATTAPSLIISDVMMPEMDGFTLLDKLKAHPALYNIPVIMLTALADNRNRLRALTTGVDDYLTKPFISSELLARTANLLGNATRRANIDHHEADEFKEHTRQALVTDETESADNRQPVTSPADMTWLKELETTVCKFIGKTDLNLVMLAYELNTSERQLFRRVKAITGLTPNKYIRTIRLQIAREAIESGKYRTIAEISYLAGFETPAYFSKLFKEHYGRDVNELL